MFAEDLGAGGFTHGLRAALGRQGNAAARVEFAGVVDEDHADFVDAAAADPLELRAHELDLNYVKLA